MMKAAYLNAILILSCAALPLSTAVADENVATKNIDAIFQPTLRATSETRGQSPHGVGLLDDVVPRWLDPSLAAAETGPGARSARDSAKKNRRIDNVALHSIANIYNAYYANWSDRSRYVGRTGPECRPLAGL